MCDDEDLPFFPMIHQLQGVSPGSPEHRGTGR